MKPVRICLFLLFLITSGCAENKPETVFSLLESSHTNVTFMNVLEESEKFNVLNYGYFYNGGGVAIGDIDNDGLPDLYFTGNMVESKLYLNKGDFSFEDISKKAGVEAKDHWNTGVTMADVNGDAFLDIYICRSAAINPNLRKNILFINNGDLTFTESAAAYGIDDSGYSTQASFFDFDKDGDLDLYVMNHATQQYAGFGQITANLKNRKNDAYSDKLYQNNDGEFTDISEKAGLISNVLGFGLGIAIADINNDSWPDIYISNDYNEQDYLYINNKNGTFTEDLNSFIGHTSLFSMGSDIADFNNDGFVDIMTLDMLPESNERQKMVSGPDNYNKFSLLAKSGFYHQSMRNMLQLNNQGTSFSEIGQFSGVSNTDWSWASLFADFDNDGYKDLFISNGYKRDYTNMDFMNYAVQEKLKENKTGNETAISELLENIPATLSENYTFRNNGDLTFEKMNKSWGLDQKSLSNGAAYADLDNDGDLDLVVNNIDEEPFIYRNNSIEQGSNRYLSIKLQGNTENTFGIGTKVSLKVGDRTLTQELMPTRGFQSSVDYTLVFGVGEADTIPEISIDWPNGKLQNLKNVSTNKTLVVLQDEAKNLVLNRPLGSKPIFLLDTVNQPLTYNHIENNFIDFNREQLLPHKLSNLGPKIAVSDINNDGLEDVFVGGAKGSVGKLFTQDRQGNFNEMDTQVFIQDKTSEDLGALFFDANGDNHVDLYVVSGGNDFNVNAQELQDRLYLNDGSSKFTKSKTALPIMLESGSCIRAGDYDNDGDLDLFIGGRITPGKYPLSPQSYLLENDGDGKFKEITRDTNAELERLGMVSDAIWTDFNNDKSLDLIVVGEYMPVRFFKNNNGKMIELNNSGLGNTEGWWNTIKSGDFDQDGDIDYVVGNLGLNSQLKATADEPVTLYAKDFDNNGSIDPILCSYIMGESYPVFSKDDMVGQLSGLKNKYTNYSDYANQKITDLFTEEELKDAQVLIAKKFASSYIENLGNETFKVTDLPAEAQFSSIHSILVNDFNQDGHLDILLAGNSFGNRVKFGRYDANKGLVLLGNGQGAFEAAQINKSGLNISGEVRDMAQITTAEKQELLLIARNNDSILIYEHIGN